jgi:succinate dehydrogenase/fumarate reductase-like Fe-S protein
VPRVVVETSVAHDTQERVTISPLAGKPAPKAMLVDLTGLEQAYYHMRCLRSCHRR